MSKVQIDAEVINKLVSLLEKIESASNKLDRVDYDTGVIVDIAEIKKDISYIKNQILEHCRLLEGEKGVVKIVGELKTDLDGRKTQKNEWKTWQVVIATIMGSFITGLIIAVVQAWLGKIFN